MPGTAPVALAALIALTVGQKEDDDYRAYGQTWEVVEKTEHYKIHSMVSGTLTEKIGQRQEMILRKYREIFPKKNFPKAHEDVVFPVLVFETRGEYEAFSRSIGFDPTGSGAFYSPAGGYTVLYYGTDKALFTSLFHEAFHQFLDHTLEKKKVIPRWLDEGLADFFGGAKVDEKTGTVSTRPGDVDVSEINQTRKAMLTGTEIGVEELMTAPIQDFYDEKKKSLFYSEGLSIVYFLMYWKGKKGIKLIGKYIEALEEGMDLKEAYKMVFKKEMPTMEKKWKKAILSLKF